MNGRLDKMIARLGRIENGTAQRDAWDMARGLNQGATNATILSQLIGIDGAVPPNFPATLADIRGMSSNLAGGLLQVSHHLLVYPRH